MDSIMQVHENKNEMYELIGKQREAVDGKAIADILSTEAFSTESLQEKRIASKAKPEQIIRMIEFKAKQAQYEGELRELEKKRDTPEEMIAYFEKLLQVEQNNMEMRLMMASILGKETVAKRIRAESLEKISTLRLVVLDYYEKQAQKGQMTEQRNNLAAEYAKEEAAYQEAAAEFNIRVLTTAALASIKGERSKPEDEAGTIRDFLNADFSTRALVAGYVIQNMNTCLHNVELIRRMRKMVFTGEDAEKAARKLAAVSEYENVVESALWEYGLSIDYDVLQIREINPNDEAFAKRRQAYLENGIQRFYSDMRRFKVWNKNGGQLPDGYQETSDQTRVEERLNALEVSFKIPLLKESDLHIVKSATRSVGIAGKAMTGSEIKASAAEVQGKMEHTRVKMRLYRLYQKMKEKLVKKEKPEEEELGANEFASLQSLIEDYVFENRDITQDRKKVEEGEKEKLTVLKKALTKMYKEVVKKCGKYAAILLGLLEGENNGYLEVPSGIKPMYVKDEKIGLGRRRKPKGKKEMEYRDCKDMPLFTHRPNIKDIEQGGLGDCYLLSGLLSVVDQNPEEIMNIMKDNGDGTVTVCFKPSKVVKTGRSKRKIYESYYVTVEKTIPVLKNGGEDAFSTGALWVKMMEKAYAASGLKKIHSINKKRKKRRKRPFTYSDLQKAIERGDVTPDYDDIDGGDAGEFVGLLLGKENEETILDKNRADNVADRIGSMLPAISEPAWNAHPEAKYGHERYDSIVYEFIDKQNPTEAQRYLNLQKPASKNRRDAAGRAYLRDKNKLEEYRKSCMIHLDIVDTLISRQKDEVWKLDSEKKIKDWYGKIKKLFSHYKANMGGVKENEDDKIIDSVRDNYMTYEYDDIFADIKEAEFNITVDILQERHLHQFHKMKGSKHKPKAGEVKKTEETEQILDSHYTARERKLYTRIEESLRSGAYVTFGTRKLAENKKGKNGESMDKGLVGEHAYMLMNTRKIMVNGEEQLYFVVMNPWAETGVFYKVGADHTTRHAAKGEKEEGVFLMDLKTFARVADSWEAVPA